VERSIEGEKRHCLTLGVMSQVDVSSNLSPALMVRDPSASNMPWAVLTSTRGSSSSTTVTGTVLDAGDLPALETVTVNWYAAPTVSDRVPAGRVITAVPGRTNSSSLASLQGSVWTPSNSEHAHT